MAQGTISGWIATRKPFCLSFISTDFFAKSLSRFYGVYFVVANAARDSCTSLSSWGEASKEIDELVGFNRWLPLHKIGNCCYFCGWIPAISMNAGPIRVTAKSSDISKFLHFNGELRVCICTLGVFWFRTLTCIAEQSVVQYRNRWGGNSCVFSLLRHIVVHLSIS